MATSLLENPDQWPPVGWLTKPEAAKRLGLSESRAAALAGIGKPIKATVTKNPSSRSGQNVTLFHEGDVEAYIFRREHPEETSKLPALGPPRGEALQRLLLGDTRLPDFPEPYKPWMTIGQAAEVSGLPESTILRLVQSGSLPAIDCGPRAGGKWRIKRSDLDALEGQR